MSRLFKTEFPMNRAKLSSVVEQFGQLRPAALDIQRRHEEVTANATTGCALVGLYHCAQLPRFLSSVRHVKIVTFIIPFCCLCDTRTRNEPAMAQNGVPKIS